MALYVAPACRDGLFASLWQMVSAPSMPPIFPSLVEVDKKINFGSGVAAEEDELDFPHERIDKATNDKINF